MTKQAKHEDEVSPERIHELKKAGYVVEASDVDPPAYQWAHSSGASQRDVADRQPRRSSESQAWRDCDAYASGDVPTVAEPDWWA